MHRYMYTNTSLMFALNATEHLELFAVKGTEPYAGEHAVSDRWCVISHFEPSPGKPMQIHWNLMLVYEKFVESKQRFCASWQSSTLCM